MALDNWISTCKLRPSYTAGWNEKPTTTLEKFGTSSKKVKHGVTIWPNNSTPRYVFKKNENIYTKSCIPMFTAALHTNQKIHWHMINKMWHSDKIQYYCATKRNEYERI